MYIKNIELFLLWGILVACSSQKTDSGLQASPTINLSLTQEIQSSLLTPQISSTTTPIITGPAITTSITLPTFTQFPQQTIEPTEVNWELLPKLEDVILSLHEFDEQNFWWAQDPLQVIDAKNEIENCLWDCAKYYYSNKVRRWTIILLRAGDRQKAFSTAQKFKVGFLDGAIYEFPPDVLSDLLPNSWMIEYFPANKYFVSLTSGFSYGNIVILITNSAIFCADTEQGYTCEGDVYSFAEELGTMAKAQIQKLADGGYPP
jgi:hypothetical protein